MSHCRKEREDSKKEGPEENKGPFSSNEPLVENLQPVLNLTEVQLLSNPTSGLHILTLTRVNVLYLYVYQPDSFLRK